MKNFLRRRRLLLANRPITFYINQLFLSRDTDNSIYNGTGYLSGYYLAANGTLAEFWSTCYTSGFIPCKAGDVIRFKNVTMQNGHTNANYHRLCFFNSNHAIIGSAYQMQNASLPAQDWVTLDSNKVISQITVPTSSAFSNVAYVRVTASYMGSDSQITVNQPLI